MNQTIPANEPERLATLTNYAILDTLPEAGFDEITELAAQICGCPAALVSFVDASRQWIKAKYGPLPAELSAPAGGGRPGAVGPHAPRRPPCPRLSRPR